MLIFATSDLLRAVRSRTCFKGPGGRASWSPLLLQVWGAVIEGTGTRPKTATSTKAFIAAPFLFTWQHSDILDRGGEHHRVCASVLHALQLVVEALRVEGAGGRCDTGKDGQDEKCGKDSLHGDFSLCESGANNTIVALIAAMENAPLDELALFRREQGARIINQASNGLEEVRRVEALTDTKRSFL